MKVHKVKKTEAQVLRSAATQLDVPVNTYATRAAAGYKWCSLGKHWWRGSKRQSRVSIWCGKHEWEYRKNLKAQQQQAQPEVSA